MFPTILLVFLPVLNLSVAFYNGPNKFKCSNIIQRLDITTVTFYKSRDNLTRRVVSDKFESTIIPKNKKIKVRD